MPSPVWTLNASNIGGGSDGQDLAGCHITTNAAGTAYEFTKPNISEVLATYGPPLPTTSFTFPAFDYKDLKNWSISVTLPLTAGSNGSGSWSIPSQKRTGAQNGTFTAQADGTPVDAEDAASSAKA